MVKLKRKKNKWVVGGGFLFYYKSQIVNIGDFSENRMTENNKEMAERQIDK